MKYTVTSPSTFRSRMANKFKTIFPDENDCTNIEKAIFNYAIEESTRRKVIKKWENENFVSIYITRYRSIFINLKNKDFVNLIKSNDIAIHALEKITHYEMYPEHWKELIDKKRIRERNDRNNEQLCASTDMFTCNKCKSKKCTYYELQTRSADEPATIFVTCLNCGKNWRS